VPKNVENRSELYRYLRDKMTSRTGRAVHLMLKASRRSMVVRDSQSTGCLPNCKLNRFAPGHARGFFHAPIFRRSVLTVGTALLLL
jgi:hypothetical protein